MELSLCTQEVLWTNGMSKDTGRVRNTILKSGKTIKALAPAMNAVYHVRTKHVGIKHHFTGENAEYKTVRIDNIDTKSKLAEVHSRALGTKTLKFLCEEHQDLSRA
ncbi:hypothetical protein Plhal304r1_c010g0039921 [Plasmopara halstedii]